MTTNACHWFLIGSTFIASKLYMWLVLYGLLSLALFLLIYVHRPFRLPGILVGDGRLGGISGTISAYESLKLRGYDIVAIVFEDHGLINEVPLTSYLRNR